MTTEARKQPLVGIVVAAYNAARFLSDTLGSIIVQEYRHWICIIVDDGSADDTSQIAGGYCARDPRFQLLQISHQGYCGARNAGLNALPTEVELITIMDSDDVWLPRALRVLVSTAQEDEAVIGAHALGDFLDENGKPLHPGEFAALGRARQSGRGGRIRPWPLCSPTCFETVVTRSTIFPPGLLIMQSSVYQDIGGYDPGSVEGDWDLLIRASRRGDLAFIDEVLIGYRRHSSNFGARPDMGEMMSRVFSRAFYSRENTNEQRFVMRQCWKARQVEAMAGRLTAARAHVRRLEPGKFCHEVACATLAVGRYLRGRPARGRSAKVADMQPDAGAPQGPVDRG